MHSRFSPPHLALFIVALAVLLAFVQFGILTLALQKLGLSRNGAFLLLIACLFGAWFNIPLFTVSSPPPPMERIPPLFRGLLRHHPELFSSGRTVVAVNVGGCVLPVLFSVYLLSQHPQLFAHALLGVAIVALFSHVISRPVPGLGIAMPVFVAPVFAALTAIVLAPELSAPLAYVSGTLGVLIGADLLRLRDIHALGTPLASIGGAGTFDGIFITGIVAVLLA